MAHQAKAVPRRRALIALAALAVAGRSAAQAKVAKSAVQYQDQPKGDRRCSGCVHFVDGSACKIVEGTISPQGWCLAYSARK